MTSEMIVWNLWKIAVNRANDSHWGFTINILYEGVIVKSLVLLSCLTDEYPDWFFLILPPLMRPHLRQPPPLFVCLLGLCRNSP